MTKAALVGEPPLRGCNPQEPVASPAKGKDRSKMPTFRITAQWEIGGEMLGPIDIQADHTAYMSERQHALTKATAIFRRHGSHGNVENIICVEVNQDEIDGLYMAHHPAEGPGHLEEECPCLDGGQSV